MKHLIEVFPHEVIVTKGKNGCDEHIAWLTKAGFVQFRDFEIQWFNNNHAGFGFKKPRLAMEFKLAWG